MLALIAVTDYDWFQFLSQQPALDEVNFWRPRDTSTPQQLTVGAPVIFKLRKQHGGRVVGFGVFARHAVLPVWLAWDAFGTNNGATTFADMQQRIGRLRRGTGEQAGTAGDYEIGCLMLTQPVFFASPADWIAPPSDWHDNIVQGKAYDIAVGEGARIWRECLQHAAGEGATVTAAAPSRTEDVPRFGDPVLMRPRLGQGTFRIAVTQAYGGSCAVTSEHSLPALEAGHIRPYADGGAHDVSNGILLRSDIHKLFDKGYVGVTPDLHFTVSPRLKQDFSNGRTYYPLEGREIHLPGLVADRPAKELLEWHMDERFRR